MDKFTVTSSPHLRSEDDTRSIMLDVIIALCPAVLWAVLMFGVRALVVTAVSVAACVFFEWGYRKLLRKSNDITDLSAVVTGILIALVSPVTIPLWTIIIGDLFAIVLVKQLFGGIGKNFMNPALAARAFMFSWPVLMTTWIAPYSNTGLFDFSLADAVTSATPLAYMHNGQIPVGFSLFDAAIGRIPGSMGEISAFALMVGALYLFLRKIITWRIPTMYILTVAVITFVFPKGGNSHLDWMLWNIFSGGLVLGALFMATDYATSPVTPKGQLIYGVGCGLLTVFIRYFGSYPEGVSYAVLIMNACVWLCDKAGFARRFGEVRK